MKNLHTALGAILVTGVGAAVAYVTPAQAANLVFDFQGNQDPGLSFTFQSAPPSSLSVVVTALEDTTPVNVDPTSDGLGVAGASAPGQIDGSGVDEFLVLTFSRPVTLTSGTFSRVNNDDDFTLLVDGSSAFSRDLASLFPDTGFLNDIPFDFTSFALTGREFQFTAFEENDDYTLSTLTVRPVPEPSAILGSFVFGAFGVAFARRRKQVHQ